MSRKNLELSIFILRVHDFKRPEFFLKATIHRVVEFGSLVITRADSILIVHEPELRLVIVKTDNIVEDIFGVLKAANNKLHYVIHFLRRSNQFKKCFSSCPCRLISN